MPLATAWPPIVQTGRSDPILIVPFEAPPPVPVLPPHATATSTAVVRTISPLARTIWFPLVLVGRPMRKPHQTPPITCRPLPNSSRGESAPAASAATWDGRTTTPRQTIDSEGPPSQVEVKTRVSLGARSIGKAGAVVHRVDQLPGSSGVRAGSLEHGDDPVGRVPGGVETEGSGCPREPWGLRELGRHLRPGGQVAAR